MLAMPPDKQLSFEDKLGLLVDREWAERENRRVARRVKEARLSVRAAPEEILCDAARGLDRAVLRDLTNCQWVVTGAPPPSFQAHRLVAAPGLEITQSGS